MPKTKENVKEQEAVTPSAGRSFEKDLARLEQIVAALESGELTLDDSLCLYEEGVRLARDCHKKLDEVEGKLQVLASGDGEKIVLHDFSLDEDEE